MVVLLNLGEEGTDSLHPTNTHGSKPYGVQRLNLQDEDPSEVISLRHVAEPDLFSRAVACYPIAVQLACSLDLNSLHELSRTSRQIRGNLLQYRSQLIAHALRCENDERNKELGSRLANGLRESFAAWNTRDQDGILTSRITSGRVGACARDMVGDCRKCGRVVCRNCVVKQPPSSTLKDRHRRLCRTCVKAPLDRHTSVMVETAHDEQCSVAFTNQAFARTQCSCSEHVWICQPCGQSLRSDDVTYVRGWTWRKRYSTNLCGLGTGMGEGSEGVACGRQSRCLASREVEKEIDCDSGELLSVQGESETSKLEGRTRNATGYFMQEIEGIGGVMKKKVKKRERVGRVVKEYEDEREHGNYLSREQTQAIRSWCYWCDRVIPSLKDDHNQGASNDRLQASPSNSSDSSR